MDDLCPSRDTMVSSRPLKNNLGMRRAYLPAQRKGSLSQRPQPMHSIALQCLVCDQVPCSAVCRIT